MSKRSSESSRNSSNVWPATLAGFLFACHGLVGFAADAEVSHRARALQPGEVVLLSVRVPTSVTYASAKAFGKVFPLYPGTDEGSLEGLVGLDLALEAGRYEVSVEADAAGTPFQATYELVVQSKDFPVRRLTVEEKYVHPPAEELERIEREQALVSRILTTVTPRRYWSGTFSRPVPGAASSSFGKRSIVNGQPRSPHSGTDFQAADGTPIQAPNAGKVVLAQELYFAGNTVIVDHGLGLYSYFAHLSKFRVRQGDNVEKGDVVGLVGSTGRVTGPHLHWTARLVGTRVDPLSLLDVLGDPGASRLTP